MELVPLPRSFFEPDAVTLAPTLLGKIVRHGDCAGRIVEVEAYMDDEASHAFRLTPRGQVMRETYGHWYVYFSYGMHWCINVTAGKGKVGGVLIRAVEPLEGTELMMERRKTKKLTDLCSGPGRFTQAFGIDKRFNGLEIGGDLGLYDAPALPPDRIGASPRIGISKALHLPWRFYEEGSPFLSGKGKAPARG